MMGHWTEIEGFKANSRNACCSVTGQPDGGKPVYRSVLIEYEGFFDISRWSAEQLAKLIGWMPKSEVAMQQARTKNNLAAAEARVAELEAENEVLRAGLDAIQPLGNFTVPEMPKPEPKVMKVHGSSKEL